VQNAAKTIPHVSSPKDVFCEPGVAADVSALYFFEVGAAMPNVMMTQRQRLPPVQPTKTREGTDFG
jgi:hypothetical protein